ncbi:proline-rich receptor-like protein kinase PERK2 [Cajanus cajan]|uniref:proline-rich receptor-like protein kinase PERK2 n=1 Tax=Cajanus cajan TaxID=3821 RepID=UPI00098D95DD|nr:proline-rich receptor-like protein kinase PERK2 [Cajanus cajan]
MPPKITKDDDAIAILTTKITELQSKFESQAELFDSRYSSMESAMTSNQESLSAIMHTLLDHFVSPSSSLDASPIPPDPPPNFNNPTHMAVPSSLPYLSQPPFPYIDPSFPRPPPLFTQHLGPRPFHQTAIPTFSTTTTTPPTIPFTTSTTRPTTSLFPAHHSPPPLPPFPNPPICPPKLQLLTFDGLEPLDWLFSG